MEWIEAATETTRQLAVEGALRDSEEKYRSLFDSIDVGFCILQVLFDQQRQPIDYRFLEVNPAFVSQTNLTDAVGKRMRELAPDHEQFWFDVYGKIALTGEPARFEHQAEALSRYRWYEVFAFRIGDPDEHRVAVLFRDIADRKRRLASTEFFANVSDDLSRLTGHDEILEAVGKRLATTLNLSTCVFADVDDAAGEVVVRYGWNSDGVPSLKATYRVDDYVSEEFARLSRAGQAFSIADTSKEMAANAERYALLKVGSLLTVPYHRDERWTGCLVVTAAEPREWRADDIAMLEELSNRLFPRLERASAEQALRASEAKYRSLFETMDEGFCIVELVLDERGEQVEDLIYREVNESFAHQSGLEQDVVGKKASDIVPHLSRDWLDISTHIYQSGESVRVENYSVDTGRWYSLHYACVGGAGSRLQSAVFSDITKRKQREQLQAFLLDLSDALRPLSDAAAIEETACQMLLNHLDVERVFYLEQDVARDAWVIERDFSLGSAPTIAGTYAPSTFGFVMTPFLDGEAFVSANTHDVNSFPSDAVAGMDAIGVRSIISVPLIKDNLILRALSVTESSARAWTSDDVDLVHEVLERAWIATERTSVERLRLESEKQLRETNRRKDEFLAMLAHELRNPLAPLRTGLEFMRVSGSSQESVERVRGMMERQVSQMVRLIDDLLDVSRITSGKIQLQRAPVLLSDIVSNAIEAHKAGFDVAQVELTVDVPTVPILLDVDRSRMVQVISNLLHNAIKFTPALGKVSVVARVSPSKMTEGASALNIRVTDNGVGIDDDVLPHIFELFTQGNSLRGRGDPGLGIGLALARHLVELHGGQIDATSAGVNKGSVFVIELPMPRSPAAETSDLESQKKHLSQRVLIVDDNKDAAESMALLIEALGGQARVEHDGAHGLKALAEFQPAVVLLDIGMPGMSGYEACRLMRAEPRGGALKIVAVSGWGQEQDKQRSVDAGFDAHLTKPANLKSLEKLLT